MRSALLGRFEDDATTELLVPGLIAVGQRYESTPVQKELTGECIAL